ncbi:VanZ family protein [Halorubrum sp. CSM-61]|uniref:VanZ family protein n=1 Tax=Halorubrum sp. CSM-61 TaxID=2485838 RepID=UPI001F14F7A3|nr:VanZ family protein [Halorubrum sp. CSM-61]
MNGTDGDDDNDDSGPADREKRTDRRFGAVAFALAVLGASVVPVSWVAPGGAETGGDASGALPLDIGLTDPFHLVGYAVLTILASRAIGRGRRGLLIAAGAAVAFGFGIELVQAPIPWRSFAWRDAAVNAIGAGLGLVGLAAADAIGSAAAARRR